MGQGIRLRVVCPGALCYASAMIHAIRSVVLCGVFFAAPLAGFTQTDSATVIRGRYLVNQVGKCGDCHTAPSGGGTRQNKMAQGRCTGVQPLSPVPGWAAATPDLTATSPLWKAWGEKAMVNFFVTGFGPDRKPAAPPMPPYTLTSQDARAICSLSEVSALIRIEGPRHSNAIGCHALGYIFHRIRK